MSSDYSVLMPIFYKEKPEYLKASLDSMAKQTVLPREFILVRDYELPEELTAVINESTGRIPVKYVDAYDLFGKGLGAILKRGVEHCGYEYIARMDSDDISLPSRCEKQLEFLNANPDYALCGTNIDYITEKSDKIYRKRRFPVTNKEIQMVKNYHACFPHPAVMIRTGVIKEINYNPAYGTGEDLELWFRILEKYKGYNLREVLFHYRRNYISATYRRKTDGENAVIHILAKNVTNNNLSLAEKYYYGFYSMYPQKIKDAELDSLILKLFAEVDHYEECYFYVFYKFFRYFLAQGRLIVFLKHFLLKDHLLFFIDALNHLFYLLRCKLKI